MQKTASPRAVSGKARAAGRRTSRRSSGRTAFRELTRTLKFDAARAMAHMKAICAVSEFIPAGMNPYQLTGDGLKNYLRLSRRRMEVVRRAFSDRGYSVQVQEFNHQGTRAANLLATPHGILVPGTILFLGHHDYCAGLGAEDNGTALGTMAELARVFGDNFPVAFLSSDLEEKGLTGARRFVQGLSDRDFNRIDAVVCLECLGSGKDVLVCSRVAEAESDGELVDLVVDAAAKTGHLLPVQGFDYFWSDQVPFAKRGAKVVELCSCNLKACLAQTDPRKQSWEPAARGETRADGSVAHTRFDLPENISQANLQKTGDTLVHLVRTFGR